MESYSSYIHKGPFVKKWELQLMEQVDTILRMKIQFNHEDRIKRVVERGIKFLIIEEIGNK